MQQESFWKEVACGTDSLAMCVFTFSMSVEVSEVSEISSLLCLSFFKLLTYIFQLSALEYYFSSRKFSIHYHTQHCGLKSSEKHQDRKHSWWKDKFYPVYPVLNIPVINMVHTRGTVVIDTIFAFKSFLVEE